MYRLCLDSGVGAGCWDGAVWSPQPAGLYWHKWRLLAKLGRGEVAQS